MAVTGIFTPVLAKHSKNFSLEDSLSISVDRMQRSAQLRAQQETVQAWKASRITDDVAKFVIYRAWTPCSETST